MSEGDGRETVQTGDLDAGKPIRTTLSTPLHNTYVITWHQT